MNRVLKRADMALALAAALLLAGCVPPHMSKADLAYIPGGPKADYRVGLKVAVTPLDMPADKPIKVSPGMGGDDAYLPLVPRRFSMWFADELAHQGGFASVQYSEWDKVAAALDDYDIVVTGEITQARIRNDEFSPVYIPPFGILVLMGLLPAPFVHHDLTLALSAAPAATPDKPFWTRTVKMDDPSGGWHFLWQEPCSISKRMDDCYYLREQKLLAPVLQEWGAELLKAARDAGKAPRKES